MPEGAPNILNNTFTQSAISRLMSEVTSFLNNHWVEVLIVSAVIAIIAMISTYLKKRKAAAKLEKERREIREDLKAWKDLGKEKEVQEKAESENTENLKYVENIYNRGLDIIKQAGKKNDDINWFIMLGEPQSGKSQLLASSNIEFLETGSINDSDSKTVTDNLPLRCWLSGNAFILDIGGKEFFNKDNPGKKNEWQRVVELVDKTKKKKPLSGVIVVIPADALIADNEEITLKKSSLIAKKIYSMVNDLGMILPCHVVVTKLDMVLGCAEYFSNLNDEAAKQVFGWRNTKAQGDYDKKAFSGYWKELIKKLRAGSIPSMLNEKVHDINFSKGQNRLSITSNAYLFADEFDKLNKNLSIYLEHLFGADTWFSNKNFMLSGVYFTMAHDGRVRLSSTISEITNKPIDSSPLTYKTKLVNHSCFVKSLLSDLIFNDKQNSSYTNLKTIKKNIIYYVGSAIALIFAFIWISALYISNDQLEHAIQTRTTEYTNFINLANEKAIENSPLLAEDKDGKIVFCDTKPMASNQTVDSRLNFFNTYMLENKTPYTLPGYCLASLYTFWDFSMSGYRLEDCKHALFTDMVFVPAIDLFCKHINSEKETSEIYNATKRQAFFELIEISKTGSENANILPISDNIFVKVPFAAILTHLKPDITEQQLAIFGIKNGSKVEVNKRKLVSLLVKPEFEQAIEKACDELVTRWKSLDIYPDAAFREICSCVDGTAKYKDLEEKIRFLAQKLGTNYSDDYVCLAEIDNCISKQRELLPPMEKYFSTDWVTKHLMPLSSEIIINQLSKEYENLLEEDFAYLRKLYNGFSAKNYSFNRFVALSGKKVSSSSKNPSLELESSYSIAKSSIAEKKKLLEHRFSLAKDEYFIPNSISNTPPLFRIINNLQKISEIKEFPNNKSNQNWSLEKELLKLEKYADQKMDDLNDYALTLPKTEGISKCVLTYKNILKARINEIRYRLFEDFFFIAPKDTEGFVNLIKELSDGYSDSILGMNRYLVEECFGPLHALDEYDYNIGSNNKYSLYFFKYMLQANKNSGKKVEEEKQPEDAIGSETKTIISLKNLNYTIPPELMHEYELFRNATNNYYLNYIDYWGNFIDNSITHNAKNWKQFKDSIANLNANQINTLLNAGYSNSIHLIKSIADVFLDEEGIALKQKLLGILGAKQQTLSPDFLEICNRNLNNWAALSNDPKKAYIYLQNLPPSQKKADFMAIANKDSIGSIGWWRQLVNNGMDILKREAIKGFKEDIDEALNPQPIITYNPDGTKNTVRPANKLKLGFPICRDTREEMSIADMRKLSSYLSNLGFKKDEPEDMSLDDEVVIYMEDEQDSDSSLADTVDNGINNGRVSTWASKALNIAKTLTDKQPATFSLFLPPAAVQTSLSNDIGEGRLPLAIYKYPYISVTSGMDLQKSEVLTSASSRDIELAKGLLCDNCLAIKMYTYSDSVRPDAFIDVVGSWAPLRLYLLHKNKLDVDKNIVYVSVVFEDPNKDRYILWLGYRFGTALPLPNEWPTIKDDSFMPNVVKGVSNPEEFRKLKNGQIQMPQEFKPENMVNIDVGDDINTVTVVEDNGSLIGFSGEESESTEKNDSDTNKINQDFYKSEIDKKTIDRRQSIKEKIDFLRNRTKE